MSNNIVTIKTNVAEWSRGVNDFAAAALKTQEDAFHEQGRLLCAELIKRTPPFSGKLTRKMADARAENQGKAFKGFNDPELESMTAKAIGEKRVERDIRKVIYGLEGAAPAAGAYGPNQATLAGGAASKVGTNWGELQKCEGKQAVRVFATKAGVVYGADISEFVPDASLMDLKQRHDENRTARGRVTLAGQKTVAVGRWRWLNVMVTIESKVKEFIKWKQHGVGQAKGGWVEGFIGLGGKLARSGWYGRHAESGAFQNRSTRGNISMTITNRSKWATAGDPDRIIEASMRGRAEAIKGRIVRELQKRWGKGAGG